MYMTLRGSNANLSIVLLPVRRTHTIRLFHNLRLLRCFNGKCISIQSDQPSVGSRRGWCVNYSRAIDRARLTRFVSIHGVWLNMARRNVGQNIQNDGETEGGPRRGRPWKLAVILADRMVYDRRPEDKRRRFRKTWPC